VAQFGPICVQFHPTMTITTELFEPRTDDLLTQLHRVAENPFYSKLYDDHEIDPLEISTLGGFRELPFVTTDDLADAFFAADDRGPFFTPDVTQTFMNPVTGGMMPLFFTESDWERMTETIGNRFRDIGVEDGDVVLVTIGYTPFIAGMLFHDALTEVGAVPVPAGAGDSESGAGLAELLEVNVAIGFPSYIETIAEHTGLSLDVLISVGEPVVYYPDRREELRELVGGADTVADVYGIAEAGTVAAEDDSESGMNVFDEYMIAEVIDSDTGEVVEPGKVGELVLTQLYHEAMPMVRFRTGDLTKLVEENGTLKLPEGVFGRVDNRLKVKGVKVYPDAFEPVLGRTPGVTGNFTIEVTKPDRSTDHVKLYCESADGSEVDLDELASALRKQVLISVDEISLVNDLPHDEHVIDKRSESIT